MNIAYNLGYGIHKENNNTNKSRLLREKTYIKQKDLHYTFIIHFLINLKRHHQGYSYASCFCLKGWSLASFFLLLTLQAHDMGGKNHLKKRGRKLQTSGPSF